MPSITWTYKDYWEYFHQIEDDKRKAEALRELNGDGWLSRLSAENQAHVFMFAPEEILLSLKHFPIIKRDALLILQHERDKRNKRIRKR